MSGKRAIGAYNKGKQRLAWLTPAWMQEQHMRSINPRAPRERKKAKRK